MTSSFGPSLERPSARHANRIVLVPRADSLLGPDISLSEQGMGEARREIRGAFDQVRNVAEPKLLERGMIDMLHVRDRRERELASQFGCFRRLEGLAAYTVNFANAGLREQVLDSLDGLVGDSLEVIDDFTLGLPPPTRSSEQGPSTDHRQPDRWPELSGIEAARRDGVRGAGVLFGMLDTGIDADHCEFSHKTVHFRYIPFHFDQPHRAVRGFDVSGHGTHVAGMAFGRHVGIAPDVQPFVGSVIESESTLTSASRVLRGLDWLIRTFDEPELRGRPRVINLSLGFDRELVRLESRRDIEKRLDKHINAMKLLLNRAPALSEAMIFAAIGNGGSGRAGYPALFESVFGIGAVDFSCKVAPFSGNRRVRPGELDATGLPVAEKPDFFGYGQTVRSCIHRDHAGGSHYETMSGTSMAAPYAAAIAALYLSRQPKLSPDELRGVLTDSGLPVAGHCGKLVRYDPSAVR